MNLVFEVHATSLDNQMGVASGHYDVDLSELGRAQAADMGSRYAGRRFGAIYASDLKRAMETAAIAFAKPAVADVRLRECDYGTWTRCDVHKLDAARRRFIDEPFPAGESYRDVVSRVGEFLDELSRTSEDVLIIGHRATWYSMEHLLGRRDLPEVVAAPWKWQPGWLYEF